jgi:hypothetical protein
MESEAELIFQQAERAMQDAADRVVEDARRTDGSVVVWEHGAVRRIPANQLSQSADGIAEKRTDKE